MKIKKLLLFFAFSLSLFKGMLANDLEYPLYPYTKDLSQTLTYKVMLRCARPEDISNLDMFKVLTYIQQIDVITRGIPKVVILGGFQQDGHDHQYPWWTPINDTFTAPGNRTGKSALTWLVNMAKNYNTYCTFHVNPFDAYEDSPKWSEYIENDLICKTLTGNLVKGDIWWDRQSYMVNLAKEFEAGYTQKRIDEFIEELPIVKETGVLYFDNLTQYPASNYHGIKAEDQVEAIKKCAVYLQEKHGIQLVGEYADPKLYGYLSLGVTWDWFASLQVNQMEIPAYLMCGGRDIGHDHLLNSYSLKPHLQVFGSSIQLEDIQFQFNPDRVVREFTHHTLVYFYLNRLLREKYTETGGKLELTVSEGVVSKYENNIHTLHRNGHIMKEGYNVFIPVYWVNHPEIMAYSFYGDERTWIFPEEWKDISAVDLYTFNDDFNELILVESNRKVENNSISLTIPANTSYTIVPNGTDINDKTTIYSNPASGEVTFVGVDTETGGNWIDKYGKKGYDIFGSVATIPSYMEMKYIGDKLEVIQEESIENNALQIPDTDKRIAAYRKSVLHQILDIKLDADKKDKLSLYFADYNNTDSQILVDVIDVNTKKVLDSRIINNFANGLYLTYEISGNVQIRMTRLFKSKYQSVGYPVYSGIFFDEALLSSIQEESSEHLITTFPNPFKEKVSFKIPTDGSNVVDIRFYDISGKLMFDKSYNTNSTDETIIEIAEQELNFAKGVYLVHIQTHKHDFREKIIYK